jgi:hypothetical protein
MSDENYYSSTDVPLVAIIPPIVFVAIMLCGCFAARQHRKQRAERFAAAQAGVARVNNGAFRMEVPMQPGQTPAVLEFPMAGGQGQMPMYQFPMSGQPGMYQQGAMPGYTYQQGGFQPMQQPYMTTGQNQGYPVQIGQPQTGHDGGVFRN